VLKISPTTVIKELKKKEDVSKVLIFHQRARPNS
jgi:hypothetical protein